MTNLLLAIIYVAFVSLGLPDAILGAAWPTMYGELGANVSWAGMISMTIAAGTVVSSLLSDRLTHALGAGKVTAISVGMTALALFGFSTCTEFWQLVLWAVPYGLGAGSVDAALNNYVALHYASRHMSWLHCMWGLGATLGPYIMGTALTGGAGWPAGYRWISYLQIGLTALLVATLPLWKKAHGENPAHGETDAPEGRATPLREVVRIPGAIEIMVAFFCYSTVEQTTGLWAASYLVMHNGFSAEEAASLAALFYIGITVGRGLSGFVTLKLNDTQMIRLGCGIIAAGVAVLLLPLGDLGATAGLVLVGLGCAPIYPSIIHSTPEHFGAERSQALVGVQMASAYVGTTLMPPVFGFVAEHVGVWLLPVFLAAALAVMFLAHEQLVKKTS